MRFGGVAVLLTTLRVSSAHPRQSGLLPDPFHVLGFLRGLGPSPETDPRFTHHVPAGPNDVRSACPFMNTMANHGFINHSGRDLTIPMIITGFAQGMNVGADVSLILAAFGQVLAAPGRLSFTLSDISSHNFPIEHDASASRQDAKLGNWVPLHAATFAQYTSHLPGNVTTVKTVSEAKHARVQDSRARNPDHVYGPRQAIISYGEQALLVQAMSGSVRSPGSLTSGESSVACLTSLFVNEKLPWDLGWRPQRDTITVRSTGLMMVRLQAAAPEPLEEPVAITADSWKDLLTDILGGSEKLAELTLGMSLALGL